MDQELERTCGSNRLGDAAQEHASNQHTVISKLEDHNHRLLG
jgi:hypothetical protein